MPKQINTPIPGELLRREFGLVGRIRPALDEVIVPVVNIADLATAGGLPLERTCVARFTQSAVVGERFVAQLVVRPNTLIRLRTLSAWSDTNNTNLKLHHGNKLPATPGTQAEVRYTDGRLLIPTFLNPAVFPTFDTATAANALVADYEEWYRLATANQMYQVDLSHIVVGSDDSTSNGFLEFEANQDNTGFSMSLTWTEYQLK